MKRQPLTRVVAVLTAILTTVALSACGGGDPLSQDSEAAGDSIVVGSANFPENQLLAEIYAQALKAKGVKVTTKLNISSRETYLPALQKGEINLIPEYTGNLARYLSKDADITTEQSALESLKKALPKGLVAMTPAPAQDKDSIVVTKETADKYGLKSIADLSKASSQLVLGGPPEFKTRIDGVDGLKRVYGLTFKEFKALDAAGPLTVQALKNGQVQAANLFSTDPNVAANNFVVLDDPKNLFGAQNVVPVITESKATDQVKQVLDAVSAKLETEVLTGLVKKVVIDKEDASAVAEQWLKENQLI